MRALRTAWHLLLIASLMLAPHGLLHAHVDDHQHAHPAAHGDHADAPDTDHGLDLRDAASHSDAQAGHGDPESLLFVPVTRLVCFVLERADVRPVPVARTTVPPLPRPPQWRPPSRGPPAVPAAV